jgi:hypothetical protein
MRIVHVNCSCKLRMRIARANCYCSKVGTLIEDLAESALEKNIKVPVDVELTAIYIVRLQIDGSVLFGVRYHGFVLATKHETILLRAGGPDDEIQFLMTSYRSELGCLVAGLAVVGTLFHAGTINIQSVQLLCDYESAVAAARIPNY